MLNHRLAYHRFVTLLLSSVLFASGVGLSGCASSEVVSPPDSVPLVVSPVGTYDVRTSYVFAAPPPDAATVLGELADATDGPDDPARYLVDKLIARLPPGDMQEVAQRLAPYLAAYLQERIDTFAPQLAPSIREMTTRIAEVSRHVDTVEELSISHDGTATRSVNTLRFGPVAVDFQQIDPVVATAALSGDQLTIGTHALRIPYGSMLRAGFDHAVLPVVVPGAYDLADALAALVDCDRLGELVAAWMGIGTPDFYARTCTVSLTIVAANIYAKVSALDDEPFVIEVMGVAHGSDVNGDGAMDRVEEGRWIGAFGTAIFDGGRR
jgi:hypothetical protein